MKKREQRQERIRTVKREHQTAVMALNILERELQKDPSALKPFDLTPADFRNLKNNLEATFMIRAFAEFESGLRDL